MESTFKELPIKVLPIKEMSKDQLEQLKKSIDKEITLRQKKEREEAEKEVYNLLKTMQTLCDKYDINLYDRHDKIIYLDEITT